MAARPAPLSRLRRTWSPMCAGPAGRYRLSEVLGGGKSVVVRRGFDRVLERDVAVKLIAGELNPRGDRGGETRWRRELEISAALDHPHILPVLDGGPVEPDRPAAGWFVVIPLARDRLDRRLARTGPLGIDEFVELGAAVAAALGHGHRRGVTHPDLDTRHILLGHDNTPYLTGYATRAPAATPADPGDQSDSDAAAATDLTRLAGILVTCQTAPGAGRPPGRALPEELLAALRAMAEHPDPAHDPRRREHLRDGLVALAPRLPAPQHHAPVAVTARRLRTLAAHGRCGRLAAVAAAGLCLAGLTVAGVSIHTDPLSSLSAAAAPPTGTPTTTSPRTAFQFAVPPAIPAHATPDRGSPDTADIPGLPDTRDSAVTAVAAAATSAARALSSTKDRTASVRLAVRQADQPAHLDPPYPRADSRRADSHTTDSDGNDSSGGDDNRGGHRGSDVPGDRPLDQKDSAGDQQEPSSRAPDAQRSDSTAPESAGDPAQVGPVKIPVEATVDAVRTNVLGSDRGDRGGDGDRGGQVTAPVAGLPANAGDGGLGDSD